MVEVLDKKLGMEIINILKIGFEPTPPDPNRPATLWSNVDNRQTEPSLALAQVLNERGLDVHIREPYVLPAERYAGVHASSENQTLLHRLTATHELRALSIADDGVTTPKTMLNQYLEHCWWNKETQRRVKAFYWQNLANYHQGVADGIDTHPSYKFHKPQDRTKKAERHQRQAEENRGKEREILGELQPLTPEDVRSLVVKVVERELDPEYTERLLADVNIPWLKR